MINRVIKQRMGPRITRKDESNLSQDATIVGTLLMLNSNLPRLSCIHHPRVNFIGASTVGSTTKGVWWETKVPEQYTGGKLVWWRLVSHFVRCFANGLSLEEDLKIFQVPEKLWIFPSPNDLYIVPNIFPISREYVVFFQVPRLYTRESSNFFKSHRLHISPNMPSTGEGAYSQILEFPFPSTWR
mgnify:CR=1 FL=1